MAPTLFVTRNYNNLSTRTCKHNNNYNYNNNIYNFGTKLNRNNSKKEYYLKDN